MRYLSALVSSALLCATALSPALSARAAAADDGAAFRAACATAATGEGLTVAGADGWLFARAELRFSSLARFWGADAAAASRAPAAVADPLPAIVDFKNQLAKAGIALLVVPVPPKAVIHPAAVPGMPAGTTVDAAATALRGCQAALTAAGIDVVDLSADFAAAATAGQEPFCRTDTHWSPVGVRRAATLIRARIGAAPWLPAPVAWTAADSQRPIHGDLAAPGEAPSETLPCPTTAPPAGVAAEDRASPVVLLGDSHCLVFHVGQDLHGSGAGLADQLGALLGLPLDVVAARGADPTTPRQNLQRRAKKAGYLAGKKLVVWCFTARAFTEAEGGWAPVALPQ